MKKLKELLAVYHYENAMEITDQALRSQYLLAKDRNLLQELHTKIANLLQAQKILVYHYRNIRENVKVFYKNKWRDVAYIQPHNLTLSPDTNIPWKDLPKDQWQNVIAGILKNTKPMDHFYLAIFSIENQDYPLAYSLLKGSSSSYPASIEQMKNLEKNLIEYIQSSFDRINTYIEKNEYSKALQQAVLLKEKYLLEEWREKYENKLNRVFVDGFNRLYAPGSKHQIFLDFRVPDLIQEYDTKNSKWQVEEGVLKCSRGRFWISAKNILAVAALCRFSSLNDKIILLLQHSKRPVYSLQLQGNGTVSYRIYSAGRFKNETFDITKNQWLSFAMVISSTGIFWYIQEENRFSFNEPHFTPCDSIEIQIFSGEEKPLYLDNLYIASQEK